MSDIEKSHARSRFADSSEQPHEVYMEDGNKDAMPEIAGIQQDPDLVFTEEEEKRVARKLDYRLLPFVFLLYSFRLVTKILSGFSVLTFSTLQRTRSLQPGQCQTGRLGGQNRSQWMAVQLVGNHLLHRLHFVSMDYDRLEDPSASHLLRHLRLLVRRHCHCPERRH